MSETHLAQARATSMRIAGIHARWREIQALRNSGMTFTEIGKKHGKTPVWARTLYLKAEALDAVERERTALAQ